MKPTVITTGSSENPTSHSGGSTVNPTPNNVGAESGSNPNARQFPQFQSRFGFEPDMDDIFSDAGIRSRLHRMRDPFSFSHDPDFFPNFGSFPGRRRTAPLETEGNGIFEHIPAEFRHYIPDGFGFSHRSAPQSPKTAPQQPPQYYEAYVQPGSPTTTQPPQHKPKLCDAAIQTEDVNQESGESSQGKNLKQHGLRNTVDLGQKSPPEECRGPRSQSAPPSDAEQNSSQATASSSVPSGGLATASAYAHTAAPHASEDAYQPYAQNRSQASQSTAPPQPPPRQHFPQQQYQQAHYQQSQPQEQPTTPGGTVRTVPIFVEGRSEPVINKTAAAQHQHQQQQQAPRQPQQKPGHPTPLNVSQQVPQDNTTQAPPQTPHTAASISKIQDIQRDVLNLMSKVEHFKGLRGDKEYMFLDEMLTRNLIKLDTIDASGKESIRLARREAIKCIQASINVLEAKAEENAKTAQQTVMNATSAGNEEQKAEGDEVKDKNEVTEKESGENVVIPLPPPGGLQNTVEKEKVATEEEKAKVEEPNKEEVKVEKMESKPERKKPLEKSEISIQVAPVETNVASNEPIPLPPIPTEANAKPTAETVSTETNKEDTSKPETTSDAVSDKPVETIQNTECTQESKSESTTPKSKTEEGQDSEVAKSTGAVKKKIIKKKKVASDKKDKSSESSTPLKVPDKATAETVKSTESEEQTQT